MKVLSFPAAPRTIGPSARGKSFECGRDASRFVWKRKTVARGKPESNYKKKRPGKLAQKPPDTNRAPQRLGDLLARQRPARAGQLLAQTKAFDNLAIPIRVTTVKVIQQPPALVDHHDQPASRRMVLEVHLKMRRQVVDSLAQ